MSRSVALQLIHMDLKSKNVLLNGRRDLAKIADVGLSRIIQSTLGGAGSTPFGVGTFEYTAPEILLGRQCNEKVRIGCYKHWQMHGSVLGDCNVCYSLDVDIALTLCFTIRHSVTSNL